MQLALARLAPRRIRRQIASGGRWSLTLAVLAWHERELSAAAWLNVTERDACRRSVGVPSLFG